MEIRRYRPGEETAVWNVFYGSVRNILAQQYTADQVRRWAPDDKDLNEWRARLQQKNPFVAVIDSQIVGFAELESDGHIDCFYAHHKFQRQGIGSELLAAVETKALSLGLSELFAEVSLTGIAFFRARGFRVEQHVIKTVCDAPVEQFLVRKSLP